MNATPPNTANRDLPEGQSLGHVPNGQSDAKRQDRGRISTLLWPVEPRPRDCPSDMTWTDGFRGLPGGRGLTV
jgi:hypothetical protein